MKRLLHFVLLGLITTVVASCSKDEADGLDSRLSSQIITVTIPQNEIQTKASAADFGKGAQIDRCIMEIYRNGILYGERQTATVTAGKATFNLRLVASQTYDFVFWADCSEGGQDKHYNTTDLTAISVNGDYTGNDDDFDAFFYCLSDYAVEGAFSETVTLKRPFGQLNVKTNDLTAIPDAALHPTDVKVTFSAMPTSFNAMTGVVGDETAEVSYTANVIDAASGELSMDYIWAPEREANLADFSVTFINNGNDITTNDAFKNIPIRRNYKTNVSGNLLTKQGTISVTIDPNFDPEGPIEKVIAEVESVSEVAQAIENGATDITVTTAPTTVATVEIPHTLTAEQAAKEITITLPETDQQVTLAYTTEQSGQAPEAVNITVPTTDKLIINLPKSTVTLNGTRYTAVEATTAGNTLIVPEGVSVETLTVKGGNVEIFGTVGSIDFQNDASIIKVYAVADAETFKKAIGLANTGKCEKIVLAGNIALDASRMNLTGTLDLNGKVLTLDNATAAAEVPADASLTITGGTINAFQKTGVTQALLLVNKGASLLVENVQLETDAAALSPANGAEGASLIVRNSTVAAATYAVTTNASTPFTCDILLENSTFTGSDPVLVNVPCKLTMNKCIATGSMHGVVVRGGTARITDCDITLEYNDNDYNDLVGYFDQREWGSGNMITLAAMTIGNKSNNAYQYPTDVALVNTKLNLGGLYGSHFPALYAYANQGEGLGVTLAYDSRCQFAKEPELGSKNIVVNNAYNPWDGVSTEEVTPNAAGEYEVASPAQLAWVAATVNGGEKFEDKTVKLTSDIDLAGHAWTPIGNGSRLGSLAMGNQFKGTFDGNGKTISNLNINMTKGTDFAVGLFGVVNGGMVMNLKLQKVAVDVPTSEMAAAAVGMLTGEGTVSGVEVLSGHVAAARGNGAIVGRMIKGGTISGCKNYATVTGTGANVGGIVGAAYYTADGQTMTIENCYNYGTVTGTAGVVGGIAGLSAANVSNCVNESAITGKGNDVAGIVAEQQNAGSVKNCTNRGEIRNNTASYGTAGIVGWIRYNGATKDYPVKNVIEVTGNTNYGKVSGGNDAGGIVGTVYNLGKVNDNKNFAPSLQAATFAAGIVGNAQFTETAVGLDLQNSVEVKNNVSTTTLDQMTVNGTCKDLYVYINNQEYVTAENNRNAE